MNRVVAFVRINRVYILLLRDKEVAVHKIK